jgi:hypothetical protein
MLCARQVPRGPYNPLCFSTPNRLQPHSCLCLCLCGCRLEVPQNDRESNSILSHTDKEMKRGLKEARNNLGRVDRDGKGMGNDSHLVDDVGEPGAVLVFVRP